ncbi:hypothetical protein AS156_35465 [Bradyrhizobium macuxiense]|uniref:Uncharacterized protein n=1 Tax=Bradyrhizobium macuxiense TaxID=1755647 RepID=A0A109JZW0_9BRAD|nr:hypothetical protein AS156_35465 [Bradyrhizobium macuxiense]
MWQMFVVDAEGIARHSDFNGAYINGVYGIIVYIISGDMIAPASSGKAPLQWLRPHRISSASFALAKMRKPLFEPLD